MVFVAKMSLKVCKFYEELIKSDPLVQTVVCRFHCSWSSSTETCDSGGLTSMAYLSTVTFLLQYLSRQGIAFVAYQLRGTPFWTKTKKSIKQATRQGAKAHNWTRNASVCGVMVFTVSLRTWLRPFCQPQL